MAEPEFADAERDKKRVERELHPLKGIEASASAAIAGRELTNASRAAHAELPGALRHAFISGSQPLEVTIPPMAQAPTAA